MVSSNRNVPHHFAKRQAAKLLARFRINIAESSRAQREGLFKPLSVADFAATRWARSSARSLLSSSACRSSNALREQPTMNSSAARPIRSWLGAAPWLHAPSRRRLVTTSAKRMRHDAKKHPWFAPKRRQGGGDPRNKAGRARNAHRQAQQKRHYDRARRLTQSGSLLCRVTQTHCRWIALTTPPNAALAKVYRTPGVQDVRPLEAVSRQAAMANAMLRGRWADPAHRARIAARMATRGQDAGCRASERQQPRRQALAARRTRCRRAPNEAGVPRGVRARGCLAGLTRRRPDQVLLRLALAARMPEAPRRIFP